MHFTTPAPNSRFNRSAITGREQWSSQAQCSSAAITAQAATLRSGKNRRLPRYVCDSYRFTGNRADEQKLLRDSTLQRGVPLRIYMRQWRAYHRDRPAVALNGGLVGDPIDAGSQPRDDGEIVVDELLYKPPSAEQAGSRRF